jgi:nucleolar GTP-binding protein
MRSPFDNIRILMPKELLDKAFLKAKKSNAQVPERAGALMRGVRKETRRVEIVSAILTEELKKMVESIPNLTEIPEFYSKLCHLLVNNDELKLSLGKLSGTVPVIVKLAKDTVKEISRCKNARECANLRKTYYGRISSIINKQKETLEYLTAAVKKLQSVPDLNLNLPCVVCAGAPNVGKSSLTAKISTFTPEISEYPFTTKGILIGNYKDEANFVYFQVVDTPGILDRPMESRNTIEQQAILALNLIASLVLFVFDPTVTSGYTFEHQKKLYFEIKEKFADPKNIGIRVIINKIDLATPDVIKRVIDELKLSEGEYLKVNAKDGENTDKVIQFIKTYFKEKEFVR